MKRHNSTADDGTRDFLGGKRPRQDEPEDDAPEVDPEEEFELDEDEALYNDAMDVEEHELSIPEASKKRWCRPPVSPLDAATQPLILQQMDTDYYVQAPRPEMAALAAKHGKRYETYGGQVPILRLYGVTEEGYSCMVHVHGYEPYFFVEAPEGMTEDKCRGLAEALNRNMANKVDSSKKTSDGRYIRYVEMAYKQSVYNYREQDVKKFIKVVTVWPQHVPAARSIFQDGFTIPDVGHQGPMLTYESNVVFVMRYMVDAKLVGANWVTLPAGKYLTRETMSCTCQLEADIFWTDLVSHEPDGEWSKVGPLRILSFDIECQGRKGQFPQAEQDPVIQIANWVTIQGCDTPCVKNIFTLNTCAAISGAEVHSFEKERDMLQAWRDFVVACDPDIITGYNILGFDIPYLVDRAKTLKVDSFAHLGRMKGVRCRVKKTTFSSAQTGVRESNEITIDGRVIFDVLQAMQRDYKLHSYSLNAVSAKYLGEQKEDVHHSIISDLQNGNAEDRRRLAVYCLKDAYLPVRLMDKLMFLFNYMEMARVTGVPLGWLLYRGQMLKVLSQLLRKAQQKDLLIPALKPQSSDDTYEGATVIEPKKGFYSEPIATLDFASLYPSIMMAHNLCYSTLIRKDQVPAIRAKLGEDKITRTPNGDHFVKPEVKKGILPEILDELLAARKRAKADLKKETDPQRKAVLDGRQLALKVSANSVYGFTGATVGKLPCFEISAGVTSFGRDMIEATKRKVEEHYTVANGYAHDAVVVYGDTDSVMIKFGVTKAEAPDELADDKSRERWMLQECMGLAEEAADVVNKLFIKPIKLEFEKVYYPYLLMNKKRYAALYWTNPDKFDKMDCKGIETVRRDNCGLVRTMIDKCLTTILMERDPKKAENYVKDTISALLQNKVDISELIITKQLNKTEDNMKVMMAHVVLAKKMKERDPNTAPVLGERVPYVIVQGCKGAKAFEKAEDPIFVLENNIPIDSQWYVEHQLTNPIVRLFEAISDNPKSLLHGDHTLKVKQMTSSNSALAKFVTNKAKCLAPKCGVPLNDKDGETAVCRHHKAEEPQICMHTIIKVNEMQENFSRLWTQCQRCQGSLHQEVLCTAKDCPIFYRRRKAHKDLIETQKQLERFSTSW